MQMYHYRGASPNFGDELNVWMWPRLLPDFFDGSANELFLCIGSILFDFHPQNSRKIVFGAGYGGYTAPPQIDDSWDFYFVRGLLTSAPSVSTRGLVSAMQPSCCVRASTRARRSVSRHRSCRTGRAPSMVTRGRRAKRHTCITLIRVRRLRQSSKRYSPPSLS